MVSTSGRLNADFIRLVYLHATKETKNYLDAIDPVDAEAGQEADAAGGRRDREFLVQRSRFLAALKIILQLAFRSIVGPARYWARVSTRDLMHMISQTQ